MSYANLHGYNEPAGASGGDVPIVSGKPKVIDYKAATLSETWSGSLMAPAVSPISTDDDEVASAVIPKGYNDDTTHNTVQGKRVYLHKGDYYFPCKVSLYFIPYTIHHTKTAQLVSKEYCFPYSTPVIYSFYRGTYTYTAVTDENWQKLQKGQMGLPIITWQGIFFFAWDESNYVTTKPAGVILEYGAEDYEAYKLLKAQAAKIFGSVTEIPNRQYITGNANKTRKFNGKYVGIHGTREIPVTPTEYLPGGYANVSVLGVRGYTGKVPAFSWTNQMSFQNYIAWCYAAINTTRYLYDHPSVYGLNGDTYRPYGISKGIESEYAGDPYMRIRYQQFGFNDNFEPCLASGNTINGRLVRPYGIPDLAKAVSDSGQASSSQPVFGFGHGVFSSRYFLTNEDGEQIVARESSALMSTVPVGLPNTVISPIKYDWNAAGRGRYATGYISFGTVKAGESGGSYCKENNLGILTAGGDGTNTAQARTANVTGVAPKQMYWNMFSVLCFSHKRGEITPKEDS